MMMRAKVSRVLMMSKSILIFCKATSLNMKGPPLDFDLFRPNNCATLVGLLSRRASAPHQRCTNISPSLVHSRHEQVSISIRELVVVSVHS